MEESFLQIKGLKVFTRITGKGSPFLILHGWGSSSDSWLEVQKNLGQKFSVICFDLPGFGKSSLPDSVWDLDNYVELVIDLVNKLGIEKFYLLGHSFGGRIAIKLALAFPKRVERLILVDAAGIREQKKGLSFVKFFRFLARFSFLKRAFYKFVVKSSDYLQATGIMKQVFKKVVEEDLRNLLQDIEVKTLIIWGRFDKATPLRNGRLMKEKIKNSKLKILETGHSPHLRAPEKLVQTIYEN